VRKCKLYHPDV